MILTLDQIHQIIGGVIFGDRQLEINGISSLQQANAGQITFLANPKYRNQIDQTSASAIILGQDIEPTEQLVESGICVAEPYYAFLQVHKTFADAAIADPIGIDPTAQIGEQVVLGEDVSVQANCIIANEVQIGDRTVISPFTYIGSKSKIGCHTRIHASVTVREEVSIGDRVVVHNSAVIGSDGFGFATFEDQHHKIPQIGTVVIEDDVEIGANTTVDRAALANTATVIGQGTKIDNLVQIAHNVEIGKHCLIAAQVGISGSTKIGNYVTLAGQVGIAGHLTIGDHNVILARSGVTKSIPDNAGIISGFPARLHRDELKAQAQARRSTQINRELQDLRQRIIGLEAILKQNGIGN